MSLFGIRRFRKLEFEVEAVRSRREHRGPAEVLPRVNRNKREGTVEGGSFLNCDSGGNLRRKNMESREKGKRKMDRSRCG